MTRGQTYSRKEAIKLLTFLLDGQSELFESPKCLEDLIKVRIENAEKEKVHFFYFLFTVKKLSVIKNVINSDNFHSWVH